MLKPVLLTLIIFSFQAFSACSEEHQDLACDPGKFACSQCYDVLQNEILINDMNKYNLQRAFFPPDTANPVFVEVTYYFTRNKTGDGTTNYTLTSPKQTWFWTESTFYLFQPLESLQFTSLFFSDLTLRKSNVTLYLQRECLNAIDEMLKLLTQRLKAIAAEKILHIELTEEYFDVKAENLTTLNNLHAGKNGAIFAGEYISYLAISFQVIFPIVAFIFLLWLSHNIFENNKTGYFKNVRKWLYSGKKEEENESSKKHHSIKDAKVSTRNMHIIILTICSVIFVIYVCILDGFAVHRRTSGSYHLGEIFLYPFHDNYHYLELGFRIDYSIPTVMLIFDFLILITVPFWLLCIPCCNKKWYHIIVAPLGSISVHSFHIMVGFIQTPHHATSILIFYAIVILIHYITMRAAYYNLLQLYVKRDQCATGGSQPLQGGATRTHKCWWFGLILILIALAVCLSSFLVFLVALYVLIPINLAVDDAPDRLFSINQTLLVFITAAITYKLYKSDKAKNIIDHLMKANDYLGKGGDFNMHDFSLTEQPTEGLTKMEKADKEIKMGVLVLKALGKLSSLQGPGEVDS